MSTNHQTSYIRQHNNKNVLATGYPWVVFGAALFRSPTLSARSRDDCWWLVLSGSGWPNL